MAPTAMLTLLIASLCAVRGAEVVEEAPGLRKVGSLFFKPSNGGKLEVFTADDEDQIFLIIGMLSQSNKGDADGDDWNIERLSIASVADDEQKNIDPSLAEVNEMLTVRHFNQNDVNEIFKISRKDTETFKAVSKEGTSSIFFGYWSIYQTSTITETTKPESKVNECHAYLIFMKDGPIFFVLKIDELGYTVDTNKKDVKAYIVDHPTPKDQKKSDDEARPDQVHKKSFSLQLLNEEPIFYVIPHGDSFQYPIEE